MLDPIILNMLQNTNLGDKESRVYLAVLNLGLASVSEISYTTGLKRPHIYNILESLQAKKYVTLDAKSKVQKYIATDPIALANQLEKNAKDFKEMIPYLENIRSKKERPIVTYYTGVEGAKIVFQQIKKPKEVYYSTSISKIQMHMPEEVDRWRKIYKTGRVRKGGYHLLSDTKADREYGKVLFESGQNVRFLASNNELDMDFILYDNNVVLAVFDDDISVTVIKSQKLFNSLKIIYQLAWQSAKK